MIFHYQALNQKGDSVSDYIDASSESTARTKIRAQGLYLVKISRHDVVREESSHQEMGKIKILMERLSDEISIRFISKQIGLFSRQLATLLKAGMSLPHAITDIIDQIDNKHFRNVVADIKEKIEEGSSFSNALLRHRPIFSDMYVNMVRVGENLGSLDHVIERLAEMEEKKNILKSKVQAALYYPLFMFTFASIVVIFLMVSIIPAISEMFKDQNKDLPFSTEIVMFISDILKHFWFMIPVIIITAYYLFRRYIQTPEGRLKIDELKLKLPLIKNLYRKLLVLRFTQNLGILMNNKVDIIKSFEIVQKIVGNQVIEAKIAESSKKIREGSSISNALQKSDFLPRMVLGMIAAGEASDNLDTMLLNIGKVYETEIDLTITSLTSLIEPLIIIVMGIIIGVIVLSVMLPIMEMSLLVQ
ncbi:MAG: type II secretion system F family protein [Spirochaetae bacterium HGW-Spirochaetae-1]|jgi:general secretion pathway protein F|nr:MAG: type II secretion system F family protein [Spirochaetae bacterium HGW-Spirochaetae-1]